MEEPHPDSGTDPPPSRHHKEIKSEPMDVDEETQPAIFPQDLKDNAEAREEENGTGRAQKVVVMKEEIKEEMDELKPNVADISIISKDDDNIYCFCRMRGCTEFMIGCDDCDMWFHDTCVKIDSAMGQHIKKYICEECTVTKGLKTIYKPTFSNFMQKRERAKKAANARKLKKEMEIAMKEIKIEIPEEVKEIKKEIKKELKEESDKEYAPRAERCSACINCARDVDCGQCYYCINKVGRCLKIHCYTDNMSKPKTPEPVPIVSPKGSARRKTQRKRKSGGDDSDDDELFFSESTSTRKNIKKELSWKEEQQLIDVMKPRKRGRKKGWRKAVDGKKEKKEGITRVGKGAQFEKLNGPEDAQFDRPGYNTEVGERLDVASATYANIQYLKGQVTAVVKNEKCKTEGCENDRRDQDNYCGEECGMKAAEEALKAAAIVAQPLAVVPKKRRTYKKKRVENNDENRLLDEQEARLEAEYRERKRREELEKESDDEVIAGDGESDIIEATYRRLQRDAERDYQKQEEQIRRRMEAEDIERNRREAEAAYRALTSYIPMGASNALNNAFNFLLSQPIVRPAPMMPIPGLFPSFGNMQLNNLFNPIYNTPLPTPGFGLQPSLPAPITSSLKTAMMDHNDYLLTPILPFNNSPPVSTPSTVGNPSPTLTAPSPFEALGADVALIMNFVNNPAFSLNTLPMQ